MISWDSPYLLYAAPVVAGLFAALAFWARRVRISRAGLWSPALKEKAGRSGLVSVFVLSMCALASTIALAGPRWGQRTVVTENKALTVVLAVDVSRSMLAEDESPSRLGKVKREVTRLVQDLRGDRIGLIGFAGRSYILSPLTVDDGAIQLLVDGLDPEMASAGGTELSVALKQGRELLLAGPGIADRVLIVFSDGESHDSLDQVVEEASKIRREGIRLILAGVGNVDPVPIPIRDGSGNLIGFHEDQDGREVRTRREDQVLSTAADAAMGALVSARLNDQAGAIRDLVNAYQRSPEATTSSDQSVLRTWVFLLLAASLLALQTVTRRTSALIVVAGLLAVPRGGISQQSKNPADDAWRSGDYQAALSLYERQALADRDDHLAWLNLGTASLIVGDTTRARAALLRVANSRDPDLRFRAAFNLGWLALAKAENDERNRNEHLAEASRWYREALLLDPANQDAKWNMEIALRQHEQTDEGGGGNPPPAPPEDSPPPPPDEGMSMDQAEQLLNSMMNEEEATLDAVNRRRMRSTADRKKKDW